MTFSFKIMDYVFNSIDKNRNSKNVRGKRQIRHSAIRVEVFYKHFLELTAKKMSTDMDSIYKMHLVILTRTWHSVAHQ